MSYKINNPNFNEFVFHTILNAPQELKRKLPVQLLKYTHTSGAMKAFADKAPLEKKLDMLTRLGGAFSLSVHPPNYMTKEKLKEIHENFMSDETMNDLQEMLDKNVFVFTDREQMAINILMANTCHSDIFMLNRDYTLLAAQIHSGEENMPTKIRDIELMRTVLMDHKILCKLIMYVLMNFNFIDQSSGFRIKDLLVLFYMFVHRTHYVNIKAVQNHYQTIWSASRIAHSVYAMSTSGHILRYPHTQKYTITSKGIMVIGSFVSRVLNQTMSF